MKVYAYLPLVASCLLLSSCVGLAAGAGATVGVAAAQEGGLSRAASDARIQAQINDLWFRYNVDMFRKLDMTVTEGRVLITGIVQDPQHRVEAVRLAWQPEGVKQVINEIKVADSEGIVGFAKDTWITTRLRAAITFDKHVNSINYSIDTVQGTVYLMGFAQNQQELNHVIDVARTIENVRQVVSYVKLVGTPSVSEARPNDGSGGQYDSSMDGGSYEASPAAAPVPEARGEPIKWDQNSLYE
ncbi:MAG: BON domain-containing protein [Alphaproteobacteria bacterium]|nr:BON domain-containing protein [Alphaproteobacteria bacterium]